MKSQPTPYEYSPLGQLLDSCGVPVDFANKENLKEISKSFMVLEELVEAKLMCKEKDEEIKDLNKQIEDHKQMIELLSV